MTTDDKVRILHLPINRIWFDAILSGSKYMEYRDVKPYWTKRIEGREYDEIHFRNGYARDAPFMRVKYQGWKFCTLAGKRVYALQLGPILEIRNHPAATEPSGGRDNA